jgi:hypothetical protein
MHRLPPVLPAAAPRTRCALRAGSVPSPRPSPRRAPPLLALLALAAAAGCAAPAATGRPVEALASSPTPPPPAPPLSRSGYGYSEADPIKVGGGPQGEEEYLRHLRGPQGQPVRFQRDGSCCAFETPNSGFGGGMLDMYLVTYEGLPSPVTLYLNMYDREEPRAPEGFRLD